MLVTRRQGLVIAAVSALLPIVAVAGYLAAPGWWFHVWQTHEIRRAVDAYRLSNGRFPNVSDEPLMRELGFDYGEGPQPDFAPIDGTHYRLTYVDGFDTCWRFSSLTDSWTESCSP